MWICPISAGIRTQIGRVFKDFALNLTNSHILATWPIDRLPFAPETDLRLRAPVHVIGEVRRRRRKVLTMTKLRLAGAISAMAVSAALCLAPAAQAVESTDPIKIAQFDWTSVNINAKILGGILEKLGYTVEYPTADYLSSLTTGLTNGDLTVAVEYWDTTAGEAMKASEYTWQTEKLGTLGPKAKEEWWYTIYMKEKCPGLPNWEALKDPKCAEAFSTAETAPKGRYVGGPVTWEGFDDERVEALGLPFTVIHAGTDAAMFAELDSAYQRKSHGMLWVYATHWAPGK